MAAFDYTGYNQKSRKAFNEYQSRTSANTYARFLSQRRGSRKKFDLQQQYERQTPQVIGSFTKRGLAGPGVQSGIYQKAFTDFGKKNFQDMADLNSFQDMEAQRLDYDSKQAEAEYNQQIAELESQKQAAIARAAATLSAFRPFIGG
jgi:hypothetical protein